jgi:hypothetical protein
MCTTPLGQLIYGFLFEKAGGGAYLPFYAAALAMTGISILTRRIFYGLDRLV